MTKLFNRPNQYSMFRAGVQTSRAVLNETGKVSRSVLFPHRGSVHARDLKLSKFADKHDIVDTGHVIKRPALYSDNV
jgi:hypothetical protein